MTYLSVCSGIEAVSVAWEPLGFTPVGFTEIEKFPCELRQSATVWQSLSCVGSEKGLKG